MNLKPKLIFTLGLILFAGLMATPVLGEDSQSDEAIADWVAAQMQFTQPYDMPVRYYVDKATLHQTWKKENEKSYSRWEETYGVDKAKTLFDGYVDRIVGLFNEKTQIIYVGDFMAPCVQEAIFAHEMVHYFQHLSEGVVLPDSYGADMDRMVREMKAYNIESKYRSAFCGEDPEAVTRADS